MNIIEIILIVSAVSVIVAAWKVFAGRDHEIEDDENELGN